MKVLLQERVRRLQKQRADLDARAVDQLRRLDTQVASLDALLRQWDTLTVEQALRALSDAGLTIKVDG